MIEKLRITPFSQIIYYFSINSLRINKKNLTLQLKNQ